MEFIKEASPQQSQVNRPLNEIVQSILDDIESDGEKAALAYAKQFDNWTSAVVLSKEKKADILSQVPADIKKDIAFIHEQVSNFAAAQKASISSFEYESFPGVKLGQRLIPIDCAGCYVPGGRYAHIASAVMSIATAKVAGVSTIIACSPPRGDSIDPIVAYTMDLAGADIILEMGGVQAIASMVHGLFTGHKANIVVGPGNAYVSEAKRLLFGPVGIDVLAGPTESAIIADQTADPMTVVIDLLSQAEHGPDSPVWLFTDDRDLATKVHTLMPNIIDKMPKREILRRAWTDHGIIILCENREAVAKVSDEHAPEHLQVMAEELSWWKERLKNYGSLFLGEGSTVTHGDKASGTNHILPTQKAATYSGGLSVHKFLKVVTTQEISPAANRIFSGVASRIARMEGMEGHALACDWRLRKFFPEEEWDFPVYRFEDFV
ncbi:MAG: histidinol dehydrogenase [Saprospiraceae bacterium]|nr:histidinol dehydrogenase [Saprospiraceae bacterium]